MVAHTPLGRMGEPEDIAERLRLARLRPGGVRPRRRPLRRRRPRHRDVGGGAMARIRAHRLDRAVRAADRGPQRRPEGALRRSSPTSSTRWRRRAASGPASTRPRSGPPPTSRCPRRSRRSSGPACSPEDVDLIILGTDSPDYVTPATSVVLQHKLGAKNAGTFDVGCACASFPTGLAAGGRPHRDEPGPEERPRRRRLPDAQARRPERPDGLLLRRRRRRGGAPGGRRARVRQLGDAGRRRVRQALGHLRGRHGRAGDGRGRGGRAARR